MNASVIDTLRYADSLKAAGVEPRQADAMSRALNNEIAQGVATKMDLDNAVTELKGEIVREVARVDAKLEVMDAKFESKFEAVDARFEAVDSRFEAMDAKFDAMGSKFEAMFGAMDAKFEAMFGAMDAKFEAMDSKFVGLSEKFGTQSRYVFLVLALIVGLGLYNAAAPHFGTQSGVAAPANATPAPGTATNT